MSKKPDNNEAETMSELAELSAMLTKKQAKITALEHRLDRLERRTKSNERFANTLSESLSTQVVAIDAVIDVLRRALRDDATIQSELMAAIKEYDKHKFRRWLSGFCSVVLWVGSVALAAFVGAFIYWIFSGK